jgi:protein phosphatase
MFVLLALLTGGLWLGWNYTQSRYYVGATDDGVVAIFQGVPGTVAGLHLSRVHERSERKVDELTKPAGERVRQGIPATNEAAAKRLLGDLIRDDPTNNNVKPVCSPGPTESPSASPTPSPTPSPSVPSIAPSVEQTTGSPTVAPASGTPSSPLTSSPSGDVTPTPSSSPDCRPR